jgi:hypothetical protein
VGVIVSAIKGEATANVAAPVSSGTPEPMPDAGCILCSPAPIVSGCGSSHGAHSDAEFRQKKTDGSENGFLKCQKSAKATGVFRGQRLPTFDPPSP